MQILRITGEFNFSNSRKGEQLPSSSSIFSNKMLKVMCTVGPQAHTFVGLNLIFWKSFDLYRISIPRYCWVPADHASLLLAFSSQFSQLRPLCPLRIRYKHHSPCIIFTIIVVKINIIIITKPGYLSGGASWGLDKDWAFFLFNISLCTYCARLGLDVFWLFSKTGYSFSVGFLLFLRARCQKRFHITIQKPAYLPKNSNYQSGLVIWETSVKSVKEKERQICILNEMTQSRKHEILTHWLTLQYGSKRRYRIFKGRSQKLDKAQEICRGPPAVLWRGLIDRYT